MSNDIRSILQRLTAVEEGKVTPTSTKQGLNPQQKSVPQLPALFKPKKISVLGSGTDPEHPMKGMAVGSNESRLAETMAEIEEDMVSKVRQNLNTYLDQLEKQQPDDGRREKNTPELDKLSKKMKIDRDLLDKAVQAVEKKQAEEDLEENDYELTDPETDHAIQGQLDATLGQPQQPIKVMEVDSGIEFEIYESGEEFEVRHRGNPIKTRFRSIDDADMAVKLFRAHRANKKSRNNEDYIEER
jgi:hypothetical protein